MRAADRRRQLLEAAGRVAGREGLGRLTMVGVATEAGVSRQLVYEHFADLPTLVWALVANRFGAAEATIASALAHWTTSACITLLSKTNRSNPSTRLSARSNA